MFEGFNPAHEGVREALCTLGNGYFATRGAVAGAVADDVHYPGTYLACGYNRLRTDLGGRTVENEDLVNFPNWLALEFRIDGGDWFEVRTAKLLSYHQELDLRHGMPLRSVRFEDGQGRRSTFKERRLVSMADMHPAALELAPTADNWSAGITVRSALDVVWATGYTVIAIPPAAGALFARGVLLTPAVGAALLSASTVIVAINARLLRG